jgi:DNA polymerase-3 subunit epsilon
MARFVAIDVETANSRRASICQIGLVVYENRKVVDEWTSLVNPEDDFHFMNTAIHGIGRKAVESAPTLPKVIAEVRERVTGACVATYGDFDRSAFSQAALRYSLPALDAEWLDLQHVVKNAWPAEFTAGGWALKRVCAQLGIDLSNHHDALADARAAGSVFVRAQENTDTWARDWLGVVSAAGAAPDATPRQRAERPKPNPAGALAGTTIVFTGGLSIPRGVAEAKAAALGCQCTSSVSRKTGIVVVGEQEPSLVGSDGMSTKQRKAMELNAAGARINVLDAAGFNALLRQHGQI